MWGLTGDGKMQEATQPVGGRSDRGNMPGASGLTEDRKRSDHVLEQFSPNSRSWRCPQKCFSEQMPFRKILPPRHTGTRIGMCVVM